MRAGFQTLKDALGSTPPHPRLWEWREISAALHDVMLHPLDADDERLLLAALRFDGLLPLDETSEFPHSQLPEEAMKSAAAQALARWTGTTHLAELEAFAATARSSVLCGIIRFVIQKARDSVAPTPAPVAEPLPSVGGRP